MVVGYHHFRKPPYTFDSFSIFQYFFKKPLSLKLIYFSRKAFLNCNTLTCPHFVCVRAISKLVIFVVACNPSMNRKPSSDGCWRDSSNNGTQATGRKWNGTRSCSGSQDGHKTELNLGMMKFCPKLQ